MKSVWYMLTGIFLLLGVLTLAGVIERFITGETWVPGQSLIAVLLLIFAFVSFNRARAAK